MKKYMIVPFVESKSLTYKDKIDSILKNKNINKSDKIKLINIILHNLKKNEIFKNKSEWNEEIKSILNEYNFTSEGLIRDHTEEKKTEEIKMNNNEINLQNSQEIPLPIQSPEPIAKQTRSKKDIATPWRKTPTRKTNRLAISRPEKRKLKQTKSEGINKRKKIKIDITPQINKKDYKLKFPYPKKVTDLLNNSIKISRKANKPLNQTGTEFMEVESQNETGQWQKY